MTDLPPRPLSPLTATELRQRLSGPEPPRLVDVREPAEFISELGHIEQSELIPLGALERELSRLTGESRETIVICRSGMRAAKGAELLARAGLKVRVLTGGMLAWGEAGLPVRR